MKITKRIIDTIFITLELLGSSLFVFFTTINNTFCAMQCLFFIICLSLPLLIQIIFKINITFLMYFVYDIFLIMHFFLGEILFFYIKFKYFDVFLHFFSACFICFFGYSIIHYYLLNAHMKIQKIFSFLFGLVSEYIWEIIEFLIDDIFKTNMQRYLFLVGHNALFDTIKDMIVAILGCILFLILIKNNHLKKIHIKKSFD